MLLLEVGKVGFCFGKIDFWNLKGLWEKWFVFFAFNFGQNNVDFLFERMLALNLYLLTHFLLLVHYLND